MKGPKIAFNPMPKPELRQLHSHEEKAPYRCLDVKHSVFATRFLGLAFDLPDSANMHCLAMQQKAVHRSWSRLVGVTCNDTQLGSATWRKVFHQVGEAQADQSLCAT